MYLPESAATALTGRVAKWLRPSGVCALAEFCNYRHIHLHPPSVYLPTIAEALFQAVADARGCNPQIGNALPGLLQGAGPGVEIQVVTKAIRGTTPEWRRPGALFRRYLPALVTEGYLTNKVLDAFFLERNARSQDRDALFFSSPVMVMVGRR
jgi:hypothetical protein